MAKVKFTPGRIARFKCPPDKDQAFLWDLDTPGLALRATANGSLAYCSRASTKAGRCG